MSLDSLRDGVIGIRQRISGFFGTPTGAAVGGVVGGAGILGAAVGTITIIKKRRKKTSRKKKARRKSTRKRKNHNVRRKRKGKRKYKYARTAGKGRDTSTRRIRQTKHGQPYVILANGRARFISKASAQRSRKLKGGRY